MKRNFTIFLLLAVTVLPLLLWLLLHRRVDTKKIIDNLHLQFEDISFVSLDYLEFHMYVFFLYLL